ncbi:hypothetical protein B484DRAFT_408227 [Ochromonadaceae sp. CCMP2298]|nr:hypothetical protein B484DRAFT_408227 [Ochromonadaceae sp. CCMP2298]
MEGEEEVEARALSVLLLLSSEITPFLGGIDDLKRLSLTCKALHSVWRKSNMDAIVMGNLERVIGAWLPGIDILADVMERFDLALSGSFMLNAVLGLDWGLNHEAKEYLEPAPCADLDLFVRGAQMPAQEEITGLREYMKGLGYLRRTDDDSDLHPYEEYFPETGQTEVAPGLGVAEYRKYWRFRETDPDVNLYAGLDTDTLNALAVTALAANDLVTLAAMSAADIIDAGIIASDIADAVIDTLVAANDTDANNAPHVPKLQVIYSPSHHTDYSSFDLAFLRNSLERSGGRWAVNIRHVGDILNRRSTYC